MSENLVTSYIPFEDVLGSLERGEPLFLEVWRSGENAVLPNSMFDAARDYAGRIVAELFKNKGAFYIHTPGHIINPYQDDPGCHLVAVGTNGFEGAYITKHNGCFPSSTGNLAVIAELFANRLFLETFWPTLREKGPDFQDDIHSAYWEAYFNHINSRKKQLESGRSDDIFPFLGWIAFNKSNDLRLAGDAGRILDVLLGDFVVKSSQVTLSPDLFRYLYYFGKPEATPISGKEYKPTTRLLGHDATNDSLTVFRLDALGKSEVLSSATTGAPITMLLLIPNNVHSILVTDPYSRNVEHIALDLLSGQTSNPLTFLSTNAHVTLEDLHIMQANLKLSG
ncbi:hypothetical protein HY409_01900 [Candidatus Gottesmanbacteria bacterium]|nr:hypothetical protein [Candidatus Gottesmanbacteria bacterium]